MRNIIKKILNKPLGTIDFRTDWEEKLDNPSSPVTLKSILFFPFHFIFHFILGIIILGVAVTIIYFAILFFLGGA